MLSDHYCLLVKPFYFHKIRIAIIIFLVKPRSEAISWGPSPRSGAAPRFGTIGDGVQQQQLPEIVIELTLQAGIIPTMHCGTPSSKMF